MSKRYSLYRPRLRRQSSLSQSDTLTGLEAFETVAAEEVKPSLTFTVDLEGVGGLTDQQANRGASLFVVNRH